MVEYSLQHGRECCKQLIKREHGNIRVLKNGEDSDEFCRENSAKSS